MKTQQPSAHQYPPVASYIVGPDDLRYADLVRRGFNKQFAGKPDYVRLVGSSQQIVGAVQDTMRDQRRVVVRSGGHCLEGFVSEPAVRVVIDTSLITNISYNPDMNAFAVESGAILGEMYRKLHPGWRLNTLLAALKADLYWCDEPLPSRVRIATLLKHAGLTRHYQPYHDLIQMPRVPLISPHQEWQMDEASTLCG